MINNKFIVSWILEYHIYPQFGDVKYIQWCHAVGAHRIKPIESTNTLQLNSFAAKDVHLKFGSFGTQSILEASCLHHANIIFGVALQFHLSACNEAEAGVERSSGDTLSILRVFAGLGAWPNLPYYVMWHMTLRFWYLKYLDVIEQLEWLWQW